MAKAKPAVVQHQYEAMFLLGTAFASELDNALKIVRGMIEKHEGKILVLKKWDERKLAYELGGQKRGLYIICYFNAPTAAAVAIERDVSLSDQVLRVLLTRADHLNAQEMAAVEPQPIMPREERNTWDRPMYDDRPSGRGDRGDRGDRPPRAARHEESAETVGKD
jgi:small subunit ribosomal protein S6